jgi:predicted DNA-binding transcriptional regulator AlpA
MAKIGTNLVSRSELARRAGTTPGTVDSWRRRHSTFPRPFYIGRSPAWYWYEVEEWLATPRRSGRPRRAPDLREQYDLALGDPSVYE